MMGRDRDRGHGLEDGPANTATDWRARSSADMDDTPPPRRDDAFGESEFIYLLKCINLRFALTATCEDGARSSA